MDEMKALFGKFLEIQMGQNDTLKEIASIENVQKFWEASIGLSLHGRNCHGYYWDPSLVVQEQKKTVAELARLNQKYQQNQERLEELRKQLFAEVC